MRPNWTPPSCPSSGPPAKKSPRLTRRTKNTSHSAFTPRSAPLVSISTISAKVAGMLTNRGSQGRPVSSVHCAESGAKLSAKAIM